VKKPVSLSFTEKDIPKLRKRWPWAKDSVDEINVINVVQFLEPDERIHFVNELHRVLKPGSKGQLTVPHWCSARAYGDLAFKQPPVSEAWLFHLNKEWREKNAPWGKGYKCDFDPSWGYGMHFSIVSRNEEYRQHALTYFKEAAQDLIATLTKK